MSMACGGNLLVRLAQVSEPRGRKGRRHPLEELHDAMRSLMKTELESMLNTELDVHLGRAALAENHEIAAAETAGLPDSPTDGSAKPRNRRNGTSPKTIQGDMGKFPLAVPRDRGLTGFPEATPTAFPQARVQLCIVHLVIAAQRQPIPQLLSKGAGAFGFRGDLWTRRRVATVLQREFDVKHSLPHVGTLLRQCGWSRQKPVRRAQQRDEAAISVWPKTTWKRLKKSPS